MPDVVDIEPTFQIDAMTGPCPLRGADLGHGCVAVPERLLGAAHRSARRVRRQIGARRFISRVRESGCVARAWGVRWHACRHRFWRANRSCTPASIPKHEAGGRRMDDPARAAWSARARQCWCRGFDTARNAGMRCRVRMRLLVDTVLRGDSICSMQWSLTK